MTSEYNVGDRIQRRILSETRKKLKETQKALKDSKEQINILNIEMHLMKEKMASLVKERTDTIEGKDAIIVRLQQRLNNLNAEYNSIGRIMPKAAEQATHPREYTTLEDVYKITGENYSKDERC